MALPRNIRFSGLDSSPRDLFAQRAAEIAAVDEEAFPDLIAAAEATLLNDDESDLARVGAGLLRIALRSRQLGASPTEVHSLLRRWADLLTGEGASS